VVYLSASPHRFNGRRRRTRERFCANPCSIVLLPALIEELIEQDHHPRGAPDHAQA
jgi:hypothetical protein